MTRILHIKSGQMVQVLKDKGKEIQILSNDGEVMTLPAEEFDRKATAPTPAAPRKKKEEEELTFKEDGTIA